MVCADSHGTFRCGQCAPCRELQRKQWVLRLLMEERTSESAWFVTLTYSDENMPRVSPVDPRGTLNPRDPTLFLKRLRKAGTRFRYFLSGEYGDRTERPHYHMVMYFSHENPAPLDLEERILKAWKQGHIDLEEANPARFGYVAGYTVKKLAYKDKNLKGLEPEYARMSRMPALGTEYIEQIGQNYLDNPQWLDELERELDVTKVLRIGGKLYPLDRTMRTKLRQHVGVPESEEERLKHWEEGGMSPLEALERIFKFRPTPEQRAHGRAYDRKMRRILHTGRPNRHL